jgi:hypothetical protein
MDTSKQSSIRNQPGRDTLFISKATPGDDEFVTWLAPRLEAAGYKVFADIFDLGGGDRWRRKLTDTLRGRSQKMLLCCSDETLARRGVEEEIEIAEEVGRSLGDENFIIPLSVRVHKKRFGTAGLQYIKFHAGWAAGLVDLLDDLERKGVQKAGGSSISSNWQDYRRRLALGVETRNERLTSNWLPVKQWPESLYDLALNGASITTRRDEIVGRCHFPVVAHDSGLYSFSTAEEVEDELGQTFGLRTAERIQTKAFIRSGYSGRSLSRRDASNIAVTLIRAGWERRCRQAELLEYDFTHLPGFQVSPQAVPLGKQVTWRKDPSTRRAALNGKVGGRMWMYGATAIPKLWPVPMVKLKPRVVFAAGSTDNGVELIPDASRQHKLRRQVCTPWRNKRWHGCMMAYLTLLQDENGDIPLSVGPGADILLGGKPLTFVVPATTPNTDVMDENADTDDPTTLGSAWDYLDSDEEGEPSSE